MMYNRRFLKLLLRKCLWGLAAIWAVASITFIFMKMVPGDPFMDAKGLSEEAHQQLLSYYQLDRPLVWQYTAYLKGLLMGSGGVSLKYEHLSVKKLVIEAFPISATLGIFALSLSLVFGFAIGIISALNHQKLIDYSFILLSTIALSFPAFLIATTLQYSFAISWHLLPIGRWGTFSQAILPACALAIGPTFQISRLVRSNMCHILDQNYFLNALAKGLPLFYVLRTHAIKNTLLPLLPYLGQLSANILTGSFIIEKIFAIPGLGFWFVETVSSRDYPLIIGLTTFYSVILIGCLFVADLLYIFLDPRQRVKLYDRR